MPTEHKFELYIETLLQMKGPGGRMIRWTDLRLMRRMVRDASYRAYDPRRTLEHWHYVRSSEMRNIIPYVNTTDYHHQRSAVVRAAGHAPPAAGSFRPVGERLPG